MNAADQGLQTLTARIDKLERENRWMRRIVLLFAVVLGLGGLAAAQTKEEKPKHFMVYDEHGKERGRFGMDKDGPFLHFYDEAGKTRGGLVMGKGGMMLQYLDNNGKLHTGLSVEPDGVSILSYDGGGAPVVGVNAIRNNGGVLVPPGAEKAPAGATRP